MMEKLGREIAKRIVTRYAPWSRNKCHAPIDVFVAVIINDVGKAYVGGQEIPGEVGRLFWPLDKDYASIVDWIRDLPDNDLILVALRKEEEK